MQCIEMARLLPQDILVDLRSLQQHASLMQRHGMREPVL
jgi:hypothetical protein